MQAKATLLSVLMALLTPVLIGQTVSTHVHDTTRRFEAMHWHADGRIYSVDYYNGRMYEIMSDGSMETILSGFSALAGGGFDAEGTFYVASINTGEILRVNGVDDYEVVASGFSQPVWVLQDQSDSDLFYVSEWQTSKITKFRLSTGEVIPFVQGNGINGPDGMLWDDDGTLLVSNWNNHKIHRVTLDGDVSLFCQIGQSGNMGYFTKSGDHFYVASVTGNQVYRIDAAGEATLIAGEGASNSEDGPWADATFTDPNGICINQAGDSLLVGDVHSLRLITGFTPSLGIDENEHLLNLSLAPNPSSELLSIAFSPQGKTDFSWEIVDLQGKIVYEGRWQLVDQEIFSDTLNIGFLSAGQYTIRLQEQSGKFAATMVFLKE